MLAAERGQGRELSMVCVVCEAAVIQMMFHPSEEWPSSITAGRIYFPRVICLQSCWFGVYFFLYFFTFIQHYSLQCLFNPLTSMNSNICFCKATDKLKLIFSCHNVVLMLWIGLGTKTTRLGLGGKKLCFGLNSQFWGISSNKSAVWQVNLWWSWNTLFWFCQYAVIQSNIHLDSFRSVVTDLTQYSRNKPTALTASTSGMWHLWGRPLGLGDKVWLTVSVPVQPRSVGWDWGQGTGKPCFYGFVHGGIILL